MRRFYLARDEDATGISGTGRVAEGVIFANGTCAMVWLTDKWSVAIYPALDHVIAIHGHGGKTRVMVEAAWNMATDPDLGSPYYEQAN